jgi:hypothetical protein
MSTAAREVRVSDGELILRLGMAVVLCALIGLERSARDEVAGLRTHTLVGLGAALFTLVSAYGFNDYFGTGETPDPTRIAAQVVSGIGYLGAVVTTALVLVVLVAMRPLRIALMRVVRSDYVLLDVELGPQGVAGSIVEVLTRHRVRVESMRSDLAPEGENLHFELRVPPRMDFLPILQEIRALQDVAGSTCTGLRPEL